MTKKQNKTTQPTTHNPQQRAQRATRNPQPLNIEAFLQQDEDKDLLRLLTAGSVDDGKSTLIGRLLYDSKLLYEDHLSSLERDSKRVGHAGEEIDYALLLDGLKAEREQGITIDVAYRYFSTNKRKFIIADTPGHEQYTRNMATGGSTANLAIILIDATQGVLTQTKRHTFIVSLLGIKHIVLAVNKMDLVDFSEEIFQNIVNDYKQFITRLNIPDVHFIPLSALKGDNVVDRSTRTPWYSGPPLLTYLEDIQIVSDRNFVDMRFPVQYVNRPHHDFRGYTGTVASGVIRVGDTVMVLPSRKTSVVESIILPQSPQGRGEEENNGFPQGTQRRGEEKNNDLPQSTQRPREEENYNNNLSELGTSAGEKNNLSLSAHSAGGKNPNNPSALSFSAGGKNPNNLSDLSLSAGGKTPGTLSTSAGGYAFPPQAVTVTLKDEIDISRGDMLVHPNNLPRTDRRFEAMLIWMDETPMDPTTPFIIKHTTHSTKARIDDIRYLVDVNTLRKIETVVSGSGFRVPGSGMQVPSLDVKPGNPQPTTRNGERSEPPQPATRNSERSEQPATRNPQPATRNGERSEQPATFKLNNIGRVVITTSRPLYYDPYEKNRQTGAFILIDPITHNTSAVGMIIDRIAADEPGTTIIPNGERKSREEKREVSLEERVSVMGQRGRTLWITGLHGSGKVELAYRLERELFDRGKIVVVLDGLSVRSGLSRELDFTPADRAEHLRRVAETARILNDHNIIVIAAFISPQRMIRRQVAEIIGKDRFLEIYTEADLDTCKRQDRSKLYEKAEKGLVKNLPGFDTNYDEPERPDFRFMNVIEKLDKAVEKIVARCE
jgi:adenylyl-sulfate kinase